MEIAGFITGIIALILTGILAWKNYFSPFSVKVLHGKPRLEPGKHILKNGTSVTRFAMVLPLFFTNSGAREGVINDIIVTVKSKTNFWQYLPVFFTKYTMQKESTLGEKLTEDPSKEPFHPIHLQSKGQIYNTVLFVTLENEYSTLGENELLPDTYHFTIQISDSSEFTYTIKDEFDIEFNQQHIRSLIDGGILILETEETKKSRGNFCK